MLSWTSTAHRRQDAHDRGVIEGQSGFDVFLVCHSPLYGKLTLSLSLGYEGGRMQAPTIGRMLLAFTIVSTLTKALPNKNWSSYQQGKSHAYSHLQVTKVWNATTVFCHNITPANAGMATSIMMHLAVCQNPLCTVLGTGIIHLRTRGSLILWSAR